MAGMGNDGRHRVTKMDYRFLNTLDNIGNSPEPNLTVLGLTNCHTTSVATVCT